MITLRRIVDRLRSAYGDPTPPLAMDPFSVVLYENIAYLALEERRASAFRELKRRVGVTPQAIARASQTTLHDVAATGGV